MAKKSFGKGIEALFDSGQERRARRNTEQKDSEQIADKKNYIKFGVLMEDTIYEKLKAAAYWERMSNKEWVETVLKSYIEEKGEEYFNNAMQQYLLHKETQKKQ